MNTLKVIKEARSYIWERAFFNKLFGGENVLEDKIEKYERYIKPLFKTHEKVTAKQIKSVCGFNGSNVYGYVNELVYKGYLVKESDPEDGRKSCYRLPEHYLVDLGPDVESPTPTATGYDLPLYTPNDPAIADPDEPEKQTFSTGEANIKLPQTSPARLEEETYQRLRKMIINDMTVNNNANADIGVHLHLLNEIENLESEELESID